MYSLRRRSKTCFKFLLLNVCGASFGLKFADASTAFILGSPKNLKQWRTNMPRLRIHLSTARVRFTPSLMKTTSTDNLRLRYAKIVVSSALRVIDGFEEVMDFIIQKILRNHKLHKRQPLKMIQTNMLPIHNSTTQLKRKKSYRSKLLTQKRLSISNYSSYRPVWAHLPVAT